MNENKNSQSKGSKSGLHKKLFSLLLIIVILAGAVILFRWMVATRPKAKERPNISSSTFVEVDTVKLSKEHLTVEAMGSVIAAKSISLSSQVNGEIISVNPRLQPGARFSTGEEILSIDPSDYQLAVQQKEAEAAQARSELELEYGNQLVAKREFELLGETVSRKELDLILRKPQLRKLEAHLKAVQSSLAQARLDVKRTHIHAPFNGIVEELKSNLGTRVTKGGEILTFTGADEFWVEVLVPASKLNLIKIADNRANSSGATVRIYNEAVWGKDVYRQGEIIQLMPGLEKNGRLARLIARIEDPLSLKNPQLPKLLLNSYVRVEIDCGFMEDVIAIDRKNIRNGNQIWVMDKDSKLDIRELDILLKQKEKLILKSGLAVGEQYITSPVSSPVTGMTVQLQKKNGKQVSHND